MQSYFTMIFCGNRDTFKYFNMILLILSKSNGIQHYGAEYQTNRDWAIVPPTPDIYSFMTLLETSIAIDVSTVLYRSYVTEYIYFSTIYSTIEITLKPEQPSLTCIATSTVLVTSSMFIASTTGAQSSSAHVTPTPSASEMYVCFTQTLWYVSNENIVDQWINNITRELTVERHSLSSTIRRKISAPDNRMSAGFIGYVGVMVIVMTLGIIILSDICTYLHTLKSCKRRKSPNL